jgi:hypothetical protein
MSDYVERSMKLQQAISDRLAQFAFCGRDQVERISRHMAEVATRGKGFADDTLPLFLHMPPDNPTSVAEVALAMKVQLEELSDNLNDLRKDLADWADFFVGRSEQ